MTGYMCKCIQFNVYIFCKEDVTICKKLEIKYYVISLCNKICQIERWNVACKMLTCSSKNLFVHKIYLSIDMLLRAYFKFNST